MTTIAFLEDDETIALLYREALKKFGYEFVGFSTVASFITAVSHEKLDLLLLDWTLPDGTAETVIKWVRDNLGWQIPVIVASATDDEENVAHALWLGADDYIVKPIRLNELKARLQALLRRTTKVENHHVVRHPPYELDLRENKITLHGTAVSLTQREFDLAFFLFENSGKLVSRIQILHRVWGQSGDIETRTIDAHVSKIKKKLQLTNENGWKISMVYGYGYRLEKIS